MTMPIVDPYHQRAVGPVTPHRAYVVGDRPASRLADRPRTDITPGDPVTGAIAERGIGAAVRACGQAG